MNASGSANRKQNLIFLNLSYLVIFAGHNVWRVVFHNYTIETFQITGAQIGSLFSISAIPGVLAFTTGSISKKVGLFPLICSSFLFLGTGLIWIGLAPDFLLLFPGVLAINIGFIAFYPVINSLTLQNTSGRGASVSLGRLKSFGPLAALATTSAVYLMSRPFNYRFFLIIAGGMVLACGFLTSFGIRNRQYAAAVGGLKFKWDLVVYYTLNFLAGSRSAFFKTFVLFLLVQEHTFHLHKIATMAMLGHLCCFLSYRLIGRLAAHYEPAKVLLGIYIVVASTLIGFRVFSHFFLLTLLYCLDSLLFGVSVITDSHLKKVSRPTDFVGDVAAGLTLFHLAGVLLPLSCGIIWDYYGCDSVFLFGVFLTGLAALTSRKLNPQGTEK